MHVCTANKILTTLDIYLALYEGWLRGTHNEYEARIASGSLCKAPGASQPSTQRNTGRAADQPAHDPPDFAYADGPEGDNAAAPSYIRPNAIFKGGLLVGRQAEFYDGLGDKRPTTDQLLTRLPGNDGSTHTRAHCNVNDDTGRHRMLSTPKMSWPGCYIYHTVV